MKRSHLFLATCLALILACPWSLFAGDEPAEQETPPSEPAASEDAAPAEPATADDFPALKTEWADLLTRLREKLIAYRDAPQAEREQIRAEYAELVAQGEQLLPRIVTAAEKSFEANPDAQGEAAKFLTEAIKDQVSSRHDYSTAARIGGQLIEAGVDNPAVAEATGVALYNTGDFAGAIKMFTVAVEAADGQGKLRPESEILAGQAQQQLALQARREAILELEQQLAEAESPQEQPVREMLDLLRTSVHKLDDYEPAARISQVLIDKGVDDKGLYDVAGVAFFMTNQFDLAEEYLTKADEAGRISQLGRQSLENLDSYKKLWAEEQESRKSDSAGEPLPQVLLKTNKGDVTIELFENEAPKTVGNFVNLVEKDFYNGVVFHRVLPGFMAQGGDPDGTGMGGPGYTIVDEVDRDDHRKHFRGYLSMAKTAAPDSGGSQFFLTFVPTRHLDGKHTVFGRVIDGMEVLTKLQRIDPGQQGAAPDRIIAAEVLRKRDHDYTPTKSSEQ